MLSLLKRDILPILYVCAIITGLMYLFNPSLLLVYGACTLAFTTGFFALLHRLRREKLGGLIFILITLGVLSFSAFSLIAPASTRFEFTAWFFSTQTDRTIVPAFSTALLLNAEILLGGAVFYFTEIMFRPSFLFLLCTIPSAVASKNGSDYPIAFAVGIVAIFLLMCIQLRPRLSMNSPASSANSRNVSGKQKAVGAAPSDSVVKPFTLGRVLCTGAMCLALPVALSFIGFSDRAPYKSVFDSAIMNSSISVNGGSTGLSNFTDSSSDGGAPNNMDQLLFTVSGDNPQYLRRQVFDVYDDKSASWHSLINDEYNTGYDGWQTARKSLCFSEFVNALKWAAVEYPDEFASIFGSSFANAVASSENPPTERFGSIISIKGYPTKIIFSAEQLLNVLSVGDDERVYRTYKDEYFTVGAMDDDEIYSISYYANTLDDTIAGFFGTEEFYEKLGTLIYSEYIDIDNTDLQYLRNAYSGIAEAIRYSDAVLAESDSMESAYRADDIEILAKAITLGAHSDLEKAQKIERYFHTNGFVYNSDLKAADVSVGKFLFEVKNGVCSDYASAMVVLARAAGLNARYTEGFRIIEQDIESGVYNVRSKHAHAFPEVYITGYGWRIFEPTVSMNGGYITEQISQPINVVSVALITGGALMAAALFAAFVFIMRRRISECAFRIGLSFVPERAKLTALFKRIQKQTRQLENENGGNIRDCRTVTAAMAQDTAQRCLGKDIRPICVCFNASAYGGMNASGFDFGKLYSVYKQYADAVVKRR